MVMSVSITIWDHFRLSHFKIKQRFRGKTTKPRDLVPGLTGTFCTSGSNTTLQSVNLPWTNRIDIAVAVAVDMYMHAVAVAVD